MSDTGVPPDRVTQVLPYGDHESDRSEGQNHTYRLHTISDENARIAPIDEVPSRKPIVAKPLPVLDPTTLPKVDWLYGSLLARGIVTLTVGGGGIGKSSIAIAEGLSLATKRPLLGKKVDAKRKVWIYNLEDGESRLYTQLYAAMKHYGIDPEDAAKNILINSGLTDELKLAHSSKNGALIDEKVCAEMVENIRANNIDVLIIDPFVSSHSVNENDNNEIDLVVKRWAKIAHDEQISVHIIHHVKKGTGNTQVTTESARGAKALTDAARSVRVLNQMTEEQAGECGVFNRLDYVSGYVDKQNLAPSSAFVDWVQLLSVHAANGEWVGVAVPWEWPTDINDDLSPEVVRKIQDAVQGKSLRMNNQAADWVGKTVGPILNLDPDDPHDKKAIGKKIDHLLKCRMLVSYQGEDERRKKREFIKVGERQSLQTEVFKE